MCVSRAIPNEAVDAAWRVFADECDFPYGVRIRDFTDEQIENGEWREANLEVDAANRVFLRKIIAAALDAGARP